MTAAGHPSLIVQLKPFSVSFPYWIQCFSTLCVTIVINCQQTTELVLGNRKGALITQGVHKVRPTQLPQAARASLVQLLKDH
jgi:hypothetical protein